MNEPDFESYLIDEIIFDGFFKNNGEFFWAKEGEFVKSSNGNIKLSPTIVSFTDGTDL